jgi:CubicO group peptidase (beta-lactamase class C family)
MKDTTFWPNEEQVRRLAKSYENPKGTGLEEIPIRQLKYPLNDRSRQPMPAGGLFSTAADLGTFCRMILAGGVYERKRYVSEKAVREMATAQFDLPQHYGLGGGTDGKPGGRFEHGGAYGTHMWIDRQHDLAMVFLVQYPALPRVERGKQILAAFQKAAVETFDNAVSEPR